MRKVLFASLCLGIVLSSQGPARTAAQEPEPKEKDPKEVKDLSKEPVREPIPVLEGKPLGFWMAMLSSKDPKVRQQGAQAVARFGTKARSALPIVLDMSKDEDVYNRRLALYLLGTIRPDAKTAVEPLTELLKDKDSGVRRSAATLLLRYDRDELKPIHAAILALLKDEEVDRRRLATYLLDNARIDPKAEVEPLLEALKDRDPVVRRQAATALVKRATDVRESIPALLLLLEDKDPDLRQLTAYIVGNIRPEPKDVVPALLKVYKQETVLYVRSATADALKKIDPTEAAKEGIPILDDAGPSAPSKPGAPRNR